MPLQEVVQQGGKRLGPVGVYFVGSPVHQDEVTVGKALAIFAP